MLSELWKVNSITINVRLSTVSEKFNDKFPVFISKSKLINSGLVVSSVKLVTINASSSNIETMKLSFMSTMVLLASVIKVSVPLMLVARVLMAFKLFKSKNEK